MAMSTAPASPAVDLEANKEVVRRCLAAMERGTPDEVAAYWTVDAINRGSERPGQLPPSGRPAIGTVVHLLRSAFPDRHWQIEDLIAEGDLVTCRVTVSGTFGVKPAPPPFPMPPDWPGVEGTALVDNSATGRPYSVKHIHIFRITNGKIAEHWAARDDLGLLLQLGAVSVPDATVKR